MFDREAKLLYQKKWYKQNRERILKEKKDEYKLNKPKYQQIGILYYRKNRETILKNKKEQDERLKAEIGRLLGSACVICDSKIKILYHEIYGKPHSRNHAQTYLLKHLSDFVPLCRGCHVHLHRLERTENLNLKTLIVLLKILKPELQSLV